MKIANKPIVRDFILMLIFGILSYIIGLVRFTIPGHEGVVSDLREVPLLISVFHISNPLYLIGVSAITALGTPPEGSYTSTLLMHVISLIVSWYFYNFIKKKKINFSLTGLIWFVYVIIYYLLFLLPILILSNYLVGINTEKSFISFYSNLLFTSRFEIISSATIAALYLVQNKMNKRIKKHSHLLEIKVKERTEELATVNEELSKKKHNY